MNKTIITGYLGRDPEQRWLPSGVAVTITAAVAFDLMDGGWHRVAFVADRSANGQTCPK